MIYSLTRLTFCSLFILILGASSAIATDYPSGEAVEFEGMQTSVFGTPAANSSDTRIVVVTHGDGGSRNYILPFAYDLSGDGVIGIAMARPGCELEGRRSEGSHIFKKGDHYTKKNMALVADALRAMKAKYQTEHIFMIGHSGGAATAALIAGIYPDILEGAIMVSLPADVKKWRRYRDSSRGKRHTPWRKSLSPNKYVEDLNPEATLVVVAGETDNNTPAWLADSYKEKAAEAGKTVKVIRVEGGHNLSRHGDAKGEVVMEEAKAMMAN